MISESATAYCTGITLPGESTAEQQWPDRIWSFTPPAGDWVTVRGYVASTPYLFAVGSSSNLSSLGIVRASGGYSRDISFQADGSTYYVTFESWLYAADFKLEIQSWQSDGSTCEKARWEPLPVSLFGQTDSGSHWTHIYVPADWLVHIVLNANGPGDGLYVFDSCSMENSETVSQSGYTFTADVYGGSSGKSFLVNYTTTDYYSLNIYEGDTP